VAGIGHVHGVLSENDRIVIGERDTLATARSRCLSDGVRRRLVGEPIHIFRFTNVPVLTKLAREVASRGAERHHARTGIEVIERLFLDGIDAKSGRPAISGEHHLVIHALTHKTRSALSFVQPTIARAQIALHSAIVEQVPPTAGVLREVRLSHFHSIS
jgi:hypothetical protein